MRSHTQERLVACPTCGSMFASNTKFFDHLHRQAEPVGKTHLLFCVSVLYVLLKNDFCFITFKQSHLYVSIVEKLFPERGF